MLIHALADDVWRARCDLHAAVAAGEFDDDGDFARFLAEREARDACA